MLKFYRTQEFRLPPPFPQVWVGVHAFVDGFYVRFNASGEPKGENDGDRSATYQ
jgi:hypothetical protein